MSMLLVLYSFIKKQTSLPKVIWEEGRVAAKVSPTGRLDNDGESGSRRVYYAALASTDTVG